MLWAQHADASMSPKRTQRSNIICVCVIVWIVAKRASARVCLSHKLQAFPYACNCRRFGGGQCHPGNGHTKPRNHDNWPSHHATNQISSAVTFDRHHASKHWRLLWKDVRTVNVKICFCFLCRMTLYCIKIVNVKLRNDLWRPNCL